MPVEILDRLIDALFAAGVFAVVAAIPLTAMLVLRLLSQRHLPPTRDRHDDFTNMLILFQTMRDILEQQKGLARDLNKSLDKRVTFIRESVEKAQQDLETLHDSVQNLADMLQNTRQSVTQDDWPDEPEPASGPPASAILRKASRPADPAPPEPTEGVDMFEALDLDVDVDAPPAAEPAHPPPPPDLLDSWVGLDVGGSPLDDHEFEIPDDVPEVPEDGEKAREAFRTLLSMDQPPVSEAPEVADAADAEPAPPETAGGGNGSATLTPLQRRVYEYTDAGMTVTEIARELGVGKGEVRLILSLRKERA